MAAKKTASQIVLDIFLRESPEVCDQLLGVAKAALKSRKGGSVAPAKRKERVKAVVTDAVVNDAT